MRNLWSEDEMKFIADNYGKMPTRELSAKLNRSEPAIKTKMSRLGISFEGKRAWTRAELSYLEQNADKMKAKDIAAHLGRSVNSVLSKGVHLGIPFTSVRKTHSDEDVALCQALHKERMPLKVIAQKMEIPVNTVKAFIYPGHRGYRKVKPAQ